MDHEQTALQRAKHPRTVLAGPYGHPLHGILITIPVGTWIAALVFDIIALISGDQAPFAAGARTLVAIGVIGALIAAIFGFIDFSGIQAGTRTRAIALGHMIANLLAVVVFVVSFIFRLVEGDQFSVGGFVTTILGILIIGFSGFLGGELVYRYGVRVADEATQERGYQ